MNEAADTLEEPQSSGGADVPAGARLVLPAPPLLRVSGRTHRAYPRFQLELGWFSLLLLYSESKAGPTEQTQVPARARLVLPAPSLLRVSGRTHRADPGSSWS